MKILVTFMLLFFNHSLSAQNTIFGDKNISWLPVKTMAIESSDHPFQDEDLVVLFEYVDFDYRFNRIPSLRKNMILKINTPAGLNKLQSIRLPESFDQPVELLHYCQGSKTRFMTPYVADYQVKSFAARRLRNGNGTPLPLKYKYENLKRLKYSGEYFNDEALRFEIQDLKVGDVIELYYLSEFGGIYGKNVFYFHSLLPKVAVEYNFSYSYSEKFKSSEFSLLTNIPDSLVATNSTALEDGNIQVKKTIRLQNLNRLNYPKNSLVGKNLPHFYLDQIAYYELKKWHTRYYKRGNFEWVVFSDTINNFSQAYTAHYAGVRKFTAQLPPSGSDSLKTRFLTALCDSFNNCRYISSYHLFYKESEKYNLYRGDHLLKKRLVQSQMFDLYKDVLNERRLFYYFVNVQDKRYSIHHPVYHPHDKYDAGLVAVPVNTTVVYLMTREGGVKYHVNELPFYYEGTVAALTGRNFQEDTPDKQMNRFHFRTTPCGNANDNTRSENVSVKINRTTNTAGLSIKESLTGQFSTLLRHLYLNETIDSTVATHYFKKCTDKPGAKNISLEKGSASSFYPFRYTFTGSETCSLSSANIMNLTNWFSFPFSSSTIPERPLHNYYFDFPFTDTYNFLLEFDRPTQIINFADFSKKISNEYFILESNIQQSSETAYVLRIRLVLKEGMIPQDESGLFIDLVRDLDMLNNFSLKLADRPLGD